LRGDGAANLKTDPDPEEILSQEAAEITEIFDAFPLCALCFLL
jgi:hypothetical protein